MRSCGHLASRFIQVRRGGEEKGKGKGLGHRYSAAVSRRLLYMGLFCADRCSRVDRENCGRAEDGRWLMLCAGGGEAEAREVKGLWTKMKDKGKGEVNKGRGELR